MLWSARNSNFCHCSAYNKHHLCVDHSLTVVSITHTILVLYVLYVWRCLWENNIWLQPSKFPKSGFCQLCYALFLFWVVTFFFHYKWLNESANEWIKQEFFFRRLHLQEQLSLQDTKAKAERQRGLRWVCKLQDWPKKTKEKQIGPARCKGWTQKWRGRSEQPASC